MKIIYDISQPSTIQKVSVYLSICKDISPSPNPVNLLHFHTQEFISNHLHDQVVNRKFRQVKCRCQKLDSSLPAKNNVRQNNCQCASFFTNWLLVRRITPFKCRFSTASCCIVWLSVRSDYLYRGYTPPPFRWSYCLQVPLPFIPKRSKCWKRDFNNRSPRTKLSTKENCYNGDNCVIDVSHFSDIWRGHIYSYTTSPNIRTVHTHLWLMNVSF